MSGFSPGPRPTPTLGSVLALLDRAEGELLRAADALAHLDWLDTEVLQLELVLSNLEALRERMGASRATMPPSPLSN